MCIRDRFRKAGGYEVEFNAEKNNKDLASGLYICSLKSNGKMLSRKMLLLK